MAPEDGRRDGRESGLPIQAQHAQDGVRDELWGLHVSQRSPGEGSEGTSNGFCRFAVARENSRLTFCPISLSSQSQHRVARTQHDRFDQWHQGWLSEHVAPAAERGVMSWLMGEDDEDMIPCKTTCVSTQVKGLPVNRYQVHYNNNKAPASP